MASKTRHSYCLASNPNNPNEVAVAPIYYSDMNIETQQGVNNFYGGFDPKMQFRPDPKIFHGPTTAYNTTVEARRWDISTECLLILDTMHASQTFPTRLLPVTKAEAMQFVVRTFFSNLGEVEVAAEHTPANNDTVGWKEYREKLSMVHKGLKGSLHDLETDTGKKSWYVGVHNIGLIFHRFLNNQILEKIIQQGPKYIPSIASFRFRGTAVPSMTLVNTTVSMFGILNNDEFGLDKLVKGVKELGAHNNVNFDSAVVAYGALSDKALTTGNFKSESVTLAYSKELATLIDRPTGTSIPTFIFRNEIEVYQHNPSPNEKQGPLTQQAAVATYHPFGNGVEFMQGSRDIDIVSAEKNQYVKLKFRDALENLDWDLFATSKILDRDKGLYNPPKPTNFYFEADANVAKATIEKNETDTLKRKRRFKDDNNEYVEDVAYVALRRTDAFATIDGVRFVYDMLERWCKEKGFNTPEEYTTCVLKYVVEQFENKESVLKDIQARISHSNKLTIAEFKYGTEGENLAFSLKLPQIPHAILKSLDQKLMLQLYCYLKFDKDSVLKQFDEGLDFPFDVAAVRPWIEVDTTSAIFMKRGLETGECKVLPPFGIEAKDGNIEMVQMKYQLWSTPIIRRPQNIVVVDHASVTRVRSGMHNSWGMQSEYLKDPITFKESGKSCYPIILGPVNVNRMYPNIAVLNHSVTNTTLMQMYDDIQSPRLTEIVKSLKCSEIWDENMEFEPTLWNGDNLKNGAIPRLMGLGNTRTYHVAYAGEEFSSARVVYKKTYENKGHLKNLDSEEFIGTLNGLGL